MEAIRINPKGVWKDDSFPFNQAVVEPPGRRVHVAGQVGWDVDGNVVGKGDAQKQTSFAIDNIEKILAELGGQLSDVVSLTMYYVRDQDLKLIQDVRRKRFVKQHGPATTGIKIAGITHPELLVEITVTAVIPESRFKLPAS